MHRIVSHLRGNVVAYLALFIALGGASYAAVSVPANSVGTRQLRNHSVTPVKLDPGKIGASVRAWAVIQDGTKVIAARPRARITSWDPTFATGVVSWGPSVSAAVFRWQRRGDGPRPGGNCSRAHTVRRGPLRVLSNSGQPDASANSPVVAVLCPKP